jgi:hypothetical protein
MPKKDFYFLLGKIGVRLCSGLYRYYLVHSLCLISADPPFILRDTVSAFLETTKKQDDKRKKQRGNTSYRQKGRYWRYLDR